MAIRLGALVVPPERGVTLTLGVFDGVHLGHQALVRRTVEAARAAGRFAAALTFDPPPKRVLQPDASIRDLLPLAERRRRLGALGLDLVLTLEFTPAVAALDAAVFFDLLCSALNVREIVVGRNFAFGRARAGTVEALSAWAEPLGVRVTALDLVPVDGAPVSSSRIRGALAAGDVAAAARLLGRPFALTGTVARGDQRGRTIGFPTANVALDPAVMWPKTGVYAVRAHLPGGVYPGVANLGVRPTFDRTTPLLEVHLFDFAGDLYGAPIEVEFVERLRDEQRFSGLDALKAQIARDAERARAILGA